MDTKFLETFLLVADQGSMAEAARRLGVTPAAVAQRIAALESNVGAPLLVRAGRRVQPSDAGRAILAQSRRILADVRRLGLIAREDSAVGELRLGAISTALTGLLPPALRRLSDSGAEIELFVVPGTSPRSIGCWPKTGSTRPCLSGRPLPCPSRWTGRCSGRSRWC